VSTTATRTGRHPTHAPAHPTPMPRTRVVGPVTATRTLTPTAHDLLLLHHPDTLRRTLHPHSRPMPLPAWAYDLLRARPWVTAARAPIVISRPTPAHRPGHQDPRPAPAPKKWIPITLTGARHGQQLAAFAPHSAIAHVLRPENLPNRLGILSPTRTDKIPALRALRTADEIMAGHGLIWGPIGEVGYELASGIPATRTTSHLHLLVRAPQPLSHAETVRLRHSLRRIPVRTDIELETRRGVTLLTPPSATPRALAVRRP